jgi:hypothetical protein
VRWGPTRPEDLPQPPFEILKPKVEGKTAGFLVKDAQGVRYLVKLDPVEHPELLSGAEVVASKLLYALGYHVPSYEVAYLHSEEFTLPEGVRVKGAWGRRRAFTSAGLEALLAPRQLADGTVRVGTSRFLGGELLGRISFKRYEECPQLRALKVAYAWLNNIDAKDHNSLFSWDGATTTGYLIDFGTALGADAGRSGPKTPCAGWTYMVDAQEAALELLTLGLHRSPCEARAAPASPQVGRFTARVDPRRWKAYMPNAAFSAMTEEDGRWMAQRLALFTRAQLEAAVSAGQYRRPEDAAYLVETLDARRQAIVAQYAGEGP